MHLIILIWHAFIILVTYSIRTCIAIIILLVCKKVISKFSVLTLVNFDVKYSCYISFFNFFKWIFSQLKTKWNLSTSKSRTSYTHFSVRAT